jgi:hypothetical protein
MKKMSTLLIALFILPTFCVGQVNLKIAEDYINGKSNLIFKELEDKGYVLVKENLMNSSGSIDSAFLYHHKDGYDKFMLVKGQGFVIEPSPSKDGIDYFEYYMATYMMEFIMAEGDKAPKLPKDQPDGALEFDAYNGFRFVLSDKDSKVMIYKFR